MVRRGPRVLVTDGEQRGALATSRGLAAAGYRVTMIAEERFAVGRWSRFLEKRITLVGPKSDPKGYTERLSQVLRRNEYDMVVPGSDLSLIPISERRDLIEPYARLGLPSHEVVLRALNKPLLHSQAAAAGIAPPRSVTCSSRKEALAAAREFAFPLIVKPARSVTWMADHMQQQLAQVVHSETLLEAAVAAIRVPLTLQEYVPGVSIVSCAAVRLDGRLHGLTYTRYARTHPLENGDAAMAIIIPPPPLLTQQIEELLGLIDWRGIFELELLELGENRFGAIDFNPRPFGWMSLAIGAGANLPALWCDHVLQQRSAPSHGARVGICYRRGDAEIRCALTLLRRGCLGAAAAALCPRKRVVHPYYQFNDPGPAVARLFYTAQKAASGRKRKGATGRNSGSLPSTVVGDKIDLSRTPLRQ